MYSQIADLPADVRDNLNHDEQEQWLAVFNDVYHQTHDDDKARVAAWGAVRKIRWVAANRSVDLRRRADGLYIVEGWGMKFTSPQDPDFYGTHFSTLSHLLAEYYPDAPLWYEHGWDADYGWEPIGQRHRLEIYGFGIWVAHVLWPDHPLLARTLAEIENGKLSYSSDSIAHYAEQGFNPANGQMRVWPLAGWSLTQEPAEEGLGPVTLDGMAATIREVVESPARHIPLAGGRATLTLTACKSVYQPQLGPLAAADEPLAPASEAREAQGPPELSPDRFRSSLFTEETPMDPQMLADLAAFLGVDATPEAVQEALSNLLTALEGGMGDAAMAAVNLDSAQLREALGLGADTTDAEVIAVLRDTADMLESQQAGTEEEPPAAEARDYAALSRAMGAVRSLADQTPRNGTMPFQAPAGGGRAARSAANGGSYNAPHINRGADAPGIHAAIMAAMGYKPAGFRGRLADARRYLFQLDHAARYSSGEGPGGAWVLSTAVADTILQPLIDKFVLFEAGAYNFPMGDAWQVVIRKQVGMPEAYWAGEATEVPGSHVRWATASLTLKELRAIQEYPNGWLRSGGAQIEQRLRDDMITAINLKLQYSALFGTGGVPADGGSTGVEPLGVRWTPGIGLVQLAPAREPDLDDLAIAYGALEDANVDVQDTWGAISCSRLFRYFENMRDENGQPILREYWSSGVRERTLFNYPYYKTNAVPRNLGGGSETVNFVGDWSELAVALGNNIELAASDQVAFKSNVTVVRAIVYADTAVMVPDAFHVTTGLSI